MEQKKQDYEARREKIKQLFETALVDYISTACQCAFPRFQQLIGIDCAGSGYSFKCYDTDLLIGTSKKYFDITASERTDENKNEKWICKKCGSDYEYGWSDFSIYIERQKLELINLRTVEIGKPTIEPIPLFLGLIGHSYPPKSEMEQVEFYEFERYVLEK